MSNIKTKMKKKGFYFGVVALIISVFAIIVIKTADKSCCNNALKLDLQIKSKNYNLLNSSEKQEIMDSFMTERNKCMQLKYGPYFFYISLTLALFSIIISLVRRSKIDEMIEEYDKTN